MKSKFYIKTPLKTIIEQYKIADQKERALMFKLFDQKIMIKIHFWLERCNDVKEMAAMSKKRSELIKMFQDPSINKVELEAVLLKGIRQTYAEAKATKPVFVHK